MLHQYGQHISSEISILIFISSAKVIIIYLSLCIEYYIFGFEFEFKNLLSGISAFLLSFIS